MSKCSQFICVYIIWSEISLACLAGDSPPAVQSGGHLFSVGATANKVFSLRVLDSHRKLIVCHGLGKVCLGTFIAARRISFVPISYSNFGNILQNGHKANKDAMTHRSILLTEKRPISWNQLNYTTQWLCSLSNTFWHELWSFYLTLYKLTLYL